MTSATLPALSPGTYSLTAYGYDGQYSVASAAQSFQVTSGGPLASKSTYLTDFYFKHTDLTPYPPSTTTADPDNPIYGLGARDGNRIKATGNCGDFLSILHFGDPSRQGDVGTYGGFGVRLSQYAGTQHFYVPDQWVIGAGFQYAAGYFSSGACATVKVALGITNFDICGISTHTTTTPGCTPQEFGRLWGFVVKDTVDAVNAKGWQSRVYVWSGMDAEPSYAGFGPTYEVVNGTSDTDPSQWGYSQVSLHNYNSRNYIYGSAESGYWSDDQLWQLNYGNPVDFSSPQIYVPGQADNWVRVKRTVTPEGHTFFIDGVTAGCPYVFPNGGPAAYKAGIAWSTLFDALSRSGGGDFYTQERHGIPYLTDISADSNFVSSCA